MLKHAPMQIKVIFINKVLGLGLRKKFTFFTTGVVKVTKKQPVYV